MRDRGNIRPSTFALVALALSAPLLAQVETSRPNAGRVLEIRSYNLKPGTRDRFHQLFLKVSLPMLQRWKVDVVAYGPSLHDGDSYFLMRGFPSVRDRQRSEDAFYGSDEWKNGPREAVLADIVSYTTLVLEVDDATLAGLRGSGRRNMAGKENVMHTETTTASDLEVLAALNQDYIRSVQQGDVQRFKEILADDFLCSNPDGSLVDRARFLEQTARPVTISNLQAHDVNVRLMGDFAIVHARTTFTAGDGSARSGRYTDVWARRNGRWLAVSAHVTRQ